MNDGLFDGFCWSPLSLFFKMTNASAWQSMETRLVETKFAYLELILSTVWSPDLASNIAAYPHFHRCNGEQWFVAKLTIEIVWFAKTYVLYHIYIYIYTVQAL